MGEAGTAAFRLPLPDGWADHTAVTLAGPVGADGAVPNIVVTQAMLCASMGLGGFADGQQNLLRDQTNTYELLSNEHADVAGESALIRMIRFTVGESDPLRQLQAFLVQDGVGYAITCTTSEAGFAQAEADFRACIDGFALTVKSSS